MMSTSVDVEVLIEHLYNTEANLADPMVKLLAKSPLIDVPVPSFDSEDDSSEDDSSGSTMHEFGSRPKQDRLSELELSNDSELEDSDSDSDDDDDGEEEEEDDDDERALEEGDDDELGIVDSDDNVSDSDDNESKESESIEEDIEFRVENVVNPVGQVSMLSQMLKTARRRFDDSRNPPTPASLGMFGARSRRSDSPSSSSELTLTIFIHVTDSNSCEPVSSKMELRAVHGATVDQVIRMVIRQAPKQLNLVNDPQRYVIRMAEDDGTPDGDMPALERGREIQKFMIDRVALCDNPAYRQGEEIILSRPSRQSSSKAKMGAQTRLNIDRDGSNTLHVTARPSSSATTTTNTTNTTNTSTTSTANTSLPSIEIPDNPNSQIEAGVSGGSVAGENAANGSISLDHGSSNASSTAAAAVAAVAAVAARNAADAGAALAAGKIQNTSRTGKGFGLKIGSGKMLRRVPSHGDRLQTTTTSSSSNPSLPTHTSSGPITPNAAGAIPSSSNVAISFSSASVSNISSSDLDSPHRRMEGYGNVGRKGHKKGPLGNITKKMRTDKSKGTSTGPSTELHRRQISDHELEVGGSSPESAGSGSTGSSLSPHSGSGRNRRLSDYEMTGRMRDQFFLRIYLPDGSNTIQNVHISSRMFEVVQNVCQKRLLSENDYVLTKVDSKEALDGMLVVKDLDSDEVQLSLSEAAIARAKAEQAERDKYVPRKRRASNAQAQTAPLNAPKEATEDNFAGSDVIIFSEITASQYKEYSVIKTNKYGTRQERIMGIDREKIYNLLPKMATGFLSTKMAKRASRSIAEVAEVEIVSEKGAHGQDIPTNRFYIKYMKSQAAKGSKAPSQFVIYHYEGKSKRETSEVVAKIKYLKQLQARYM